VTLIGQFIYFDGYPTVRVIILLSYEFLTARRINFHFDIECFFDLNRQK